jgi:pentatricopeptide repeat protein
LRSEALKIVHRLKQRTFEEAQSNGSASLVEPLATSAATNTTNPAVTAALNEFVTPHSPQLTQEQIRTLQQTVAQDAASLKQHVTQAFELYHRIERHQDILKQCNVSDIGPNIQAWLKKSETSDQVLTMHRDLMQQLSVDDIFNETAVTETRSEPLSGTSVIKDANTFAAVLGLEKVATFHHMSTPAVTKHLQGLMLAGDVKQAVVHASIALDQVKAADIKFYTMLLYIFRGRKNTMMIRKTVERIKRDFPDPVQYDAKLCTLLLQVYGELEDLKQLAALMQDMRRLHIPIDIHVYNTLINIFISFNDRNNVLRILEEMRKSNIEPNSVTFAALLKYFAEQGDIDQTINLALLASKQSQPLDTILSKLLVYFTRTGRPGTTLRLLREVYQHKLKIGVSFYVPIMQRLREIKNFRDLLEIYAIARENQVELPQEAYLYVLDVATEKDNRDMAMSAFGYGSKEKSSNNILDRIRDKVLK